MRILIAGCGYVGTALGERLVAGGHHVVALRRGPEGLPHALEPFAADLTQPDTLRGLPSRLDAVFYTAAAGGGGEAGYRAAYVEGLRNLLEALRERAEPMPRVVFTSSTSVYGQDDGGWVDEASPAEPAAWSGRLVLEGEALLERADALTCAVRFGGIYGPGRTRMLERVRSGEAHYQAEPPRWTNRIHRDDCAGVLRHLLEPSELPPCLVAVDCEPASEESVQRWLAAQMQAPEPKSESAAPGGPRGRRGNKRCSNRRLLATGYRFEYPTFREGYTALLDAAAAREEQP